MNHQETIDPDSQWILAISETVLTYRQMIENCVTQLSDKELHQRPAADMNSVAVLLRHLGGNLSSRWTDFLTTDGEKEDRHRENEFDDWQGDRESLLHHFESGWLALTAAIDSLDSTNISTPIRIRGETHTIQQALQRSITHLSYHVGQMTLIARMVHVGEWEWMTIKPGESELHNQTTWGTAASRSVNPRQTK